MFDHPCPMLNINQILAPYKQQCSNLNVCCCTQMGWVICIVCGPVCVYMNKSRSSLGDQERSLTCWPAECGSISLRKDTFYNQIICAAQMQLFISARRVAGFNCSFPCAPGDRIRPSSLLNHLSPNFGCLYK